MRSGKGCYASDSPADLTKTASAATRRISMIPWHIVARIGLPDRIQRLRELHTQSFVERDLNGLVSILQTPSLHGCAEVLLHEEAIRSHLQNLAVKRSTF